MHRVFSVNGYFVCECDSCTHRSAELLNGENHVSTIYDDDYFFGGGAGYTDYLAESNLLIAQGRRYARLLSRHMQPGRLLDVGAAAGFLLKGFVEEGWEGHGIEPNKSMASHAFNELNLAVSAGSLENFESSQRYDLISMIQVIGHFVNVERAFEVAVRHLAPSGHVLVESWDRESWTARMFGRRWHEYSPPSVLHWFSRAGLEKLGSRHGLEVVKVGRPMKLLNGAHARSLLTYKLGNRGVGKAMSSFTRLIPSALPIPYPAEDLFWMLFRKV